MSLEVELRARFDKAKYDELLEFLKSSAQDLGVNNKQLYLYVMSDKVLKVVKNKTAKTAKVSLKKSRIGQGPAFPEVELEIPYSEVPKAVEIFASLGIAEMHTAYNQRQDFWYQGVEIAVKYSESWGYHAEFEVLLDDHNADDQAAAVARIRRVADQLGVQLMTEDELAAFTHEFERRLD